MDERRRLGSLGETVAAQFLVRRGAVIADRNVEVAGGELDLVALIGRRRVAVEVRSRWGEDPLASFDDSKLDRVWRSARSAQPSCTRVDLITVRFDREGVELRWLPDL